MFRSSRIRLPLRRKHITKDIMEGLRRFNLHELIARLTYGAPELAPLWTVEACLLPLLVLEILALLVPASSTWALVGAALIVWRLFALLVTIVDEVFIEPRDEAGFCVLYGYTLRVRDPGRWLSWRLTNTAEVILSFAVFYRLFGSLFRPKISGSLDAIYFSLITTTTVGYGDIRPVASASTLLVCVHLVYVVVFLFLSLPIVLSAIRVTTGSWKRRPGAGLNELPEPKDRS